MELLERFEQFQRTFDHRPASKWMEDHIEVPVFVIAAYIAMVFVGQDLMKNRVAWRMKPLVIVWNLLLSVFSIYGAYQLMPPFLNLLAKDGFKASVCQVSTAPGGYHFGTIGFWNFLFTLSKFPELLDTFFLVFQKKPLIFLHWYHHVTVLLFCWHGWLVGVAAGRYFSTMNFAVHAVMYTYYFFMSLGLTRPMVKPFAPFITILQISQMVVGLCVVVASMYLSHVDPHCANVTHIGNTKLALAMYLSYFVLFGKLFFGTYLNGAGKRKKS